MSRWLVGLAVLAMIVATLLLGRTSRAPDAAVAGGAGAADPGYSARDAEIIETGDDGRPRYWLEAARIEQPPDERAITLTRPALRYRAQGGGIWRAQAETGTVLPGHDLIELDGDVRLQGTLSGGGTPAHIATSHLAFDTKKEVASTRARVTIDWSGHRLAALGLRADLGAETLRLESQVNGRFLPH
ncbi:MAG: LPS export ABC transporter periplasmic protein LptC [Steroidobacteraceae bacterium]